MKNIIICFLMLVFPAAVTVAQNTFSIGPRAGLNFANVSFPDAAESRTGIVGGITGTYSINESTGLTLELLYSGEGYELPGGAGLEADYLQIPIFFNLFLGDLGESFRPKIYAGLATGFLLEAHYGDVDAKDQLSSTVLSAAGGLGFNYRLSQMTWLNVDLRSYLGLNDIRDSAFETGDKVAARNLQFSVGVAFGL